MYIGFIYCATSPNGKKYFGQTIQKFERRKKRHLQDAGNVNSKIRFHQALRKYNFNFKWEILETINHEDKNILINELNILEKNYILSNKSNLFEYGYNSTLGGDNRLHERRKHTKEAREQIRNSLLGVKHTKERRKNISNAHKGKDFSKNFGAPRYGENNPTFKKVSKEELDKIIHLHVVEYKTARQIEKEVSCSWPKVLKILKDNSVYIEYNELRKLRKYNEA